VGVITPNVFQPATPRTSGNGKKRKQATSKKRKKKAIRINGEPKP